MHDSALYNKKTIKSSLVISLGLVFQPRLKRVCLQYLRRKSLFSPVFNVSINSESVEFYNDFRLFLKPSNFTYINTNYLWHGNFE